MPDILWQVGFAAGAVALVAWFVLTHVFFRPIARFVSSTFLARGASTAVAEAVAKKAIYGVAIVFLFTYAYVWRAVVVDAQGQKFAVREQSRGDVHLSGALVRLGLGGFRGVTTCYLWNLAMDKQMKNQLNELEVIVGWLTELQPHFNTPWLFQSWNLAYNVSNKTDQPADKYFWISRGAQLLASGERQNEDDPDLRFELGTTYQHKICQSDETNYHRSLFQLSLIHPNERDPARFRVKGDKRKINYDEFVKFCEDHPQLIRRLREGIHKDSLYEQRRLFSCATPDEVVRFLADNFRVPSLYPEAKPTPAGADWVADPNHAPDPIKLERFPVLPPPRSYPAGSPLHLFRPYDDMDKGDVTEESAKGNLDDWDGYLVSRAWYSYAQEPIPAPGAMPGENEPVVDRVRQRVPRHMETIIFRQYPARAQSYVAERLEEEGWFDDEGWSTKGPEWFATVIGSGRNWAANAWGEADKMWQTHGERNHILLKQEDVTNLQDQAAKYRQDRRLTNDMPLPPSEADESLKEGWKAAQFIFFYGGSRQVSAFAHNYNRAPVEQDPRTVRVRSLFYKAQGYALVGSTEKALQTYQEPDPGSHPEDPNKRVLGDRSALEAWADILKEHKDFREDDLIGEESYEVELDYLDLLNRALPGNELKAQLGAAALAGAGGLGASAGLLEAVYPTDLPALALTQGPFDRMGEDEKTPWILDTIKRHVLERRRTYQPRKKDTVEGGGTPAAKPGQPPDQPSPPVAAPGKS